MPRLTAYASSGYSCLSATVGRPLLPDCCSGTEPPGWATHRAGKNDRQQFFILNMVPHTKGLK